MIVSLCESLMMGVGWDLAVMAGRETMVTVGADAALLTTARVAPVLLLRLSAGVTFGSPAQANPTHYFLAEKTTSSKLQITNCISIEVLAYATIRDMQ